MSALTTFRDGIAGVVFGGCTRLRRVVPVGLAGAVAFLLAGGVGSAWAAPVPMPGLGLGSESEIAGLVTHEGRTYATDVESAGNRRALYVHRWVDGHWQRVGGPLNDRADATVFRPSLLSVDGVLYVAWAEALTDNPGRLMLARLRDVAGERVRWEPVARATAPSVSTSREMRMVAVDRRPAVAFDERGGRTEVFAVVVDGRWRTWRRSDLVGDVAPADVTGYGNTLNGIEFHQVTVPAHDGQHGYVPARTEFRWRLNRASLSADGGFVRLRPIELPGATNADGVAVDRGGSQPLFAWRVRGEIVVAELDAESTRVRVIVRIPNRSTTGGLAVMRSGDGVAVVAITRRFELCVYRVRPSAAGPRIESDRASVARDAALELTGGPGGEVVVSYEGRDGYGIEERHRAAVLRFTFDA